MRNAIGGISLWVLLAAGSSPLAAGDPTVETDTPQAAFQWAGWQRFIGLTLHDLLGAIDIPLSEILIGRDREVYYVVSLVFPSKPWVTIHFEYRYRCQEIEERLYQDRAFAEMFFASARIKWIVGVDRFPTGSPLIEEGGMLGQGGTDGRDERGRVPLVVFRVFSSEWGRT